MLNSTMSFHPRSLGSVLVFVLAPMFGLAPAVPGQSSDALLNKLVEKGILTSQEASDLRTEAAEGATAAAPPKTVLSTWVTDLRFSGDFRGRFEQNSAASSEYRERDRYRYRLRLGMVAGLGEAFEVGVRLASGNPLTNPGGTLVGGAPITANQDLSSLESRKFVWIDAAYARWNAVRSGDFRLSATLGKMDSPFQLSNLVLDYDINPEGAALQGSYRFSEHQTLKWNGGFFVLDELNQPGNVPTGVRPSTSVSSDPYFYGGQLLLESHWSSAWESVLGVAAFDIGNPESLNAGIQPFYNSGSSRDALGSLKYDMRPLIASGALTYTFETFPLYPGRFPLKLAGEFLYNPGAPEQNRGYRVGLVLGKSGKPHTWEIGYRYQELEADAWFDALVDDDNGGFYTTGNPQLAGTGKVNGWFGGTNVRGHLIQATYSLTAYLHFSLTYYLNELIVDVPGASSAADHFMADLMWKF